MADIAIGDPTGHIVLIEGKRPAWARLLRERWARTHPVLLERVMFLPRQPSDHFMALLEHMDVLLDPIHFGGGNTAYEALVEGTPIVIWPGRFMRSRIVAGAYRQMRIANPPIAERIEDYAPLALALGRDHQRRLALRATLRAAARETLFSDAIVVRELEAFFLAAVEAAGRDALLPQGWRPTGTEPLQTT